jgi:hypothetical protein
MPPALMKIITTLDRDAVQRQIDDLREQIEAYEALLAAVARFEMDGSGGIVVGRGGHAPLSRKREVVLAVMRERPGAWTTRQVRDALATRGIDPQAGTPVKNILWNLAREGHVHAAGNGVYELSVLAASAGHVHREAVVAV